MTTVPFRRLEFVFKVSSPVTPLVFIMNCTLTLQEVGGSEALRRFWHKFLPSQHFIVRFTLSGAAAVSASVGADGRVCEHAVVCCIKRQLRTAVRGLG